jgi:hypothetical protein
MFPYLANCLKSSLCLGYGYLLIRSHMEGKQSWKTGLGLGYVHKYCLVLLHVSTVDARSHIQLFYIHVT